MNQNPKLPREHSSPRATIETLCPGITMLKSASPDPWGPQSTHSKINLTIPVGAGYAGYQQGTYQGIPPCSSSPDKIKAFAKDEKWAARFYQLYVPVFEQSPPSLAVREPSAEPGGQQLMAKLTYMALDIGQWWICQYGCQKKRKDLRIAAKYYLSNFWMIIRKNFQNTDFQNFPLYFQGNPLYN